MFLYILFCCIQERSLEFAFSFPLAFPLSFILSSAHAHTHTYTFPLFLFFLSYILSISRTRTRRSIKVPPSSSRTRFPSGFTIQTYYLPPRIPRRPFFTLASLHSALFWRCPTCSSTMFLYLSLVSYALSFYFYYTRTSFQSQLIVSSGVERTAKSQTLETRRVTIIIVTVSN